MASSLPWESPNIEPRSSVPTGTPSSKWNSDLTSNKTARTPRSLAKKCTSSLRISKERFGRQPLSNRLVRLSPKGGPAGSSGRARGRTVITSDSHRSSILLLGGVVTDDPRLAERLHSEGLCFRRANWAALGTRELEAVDAIVVDQQLEHHVEEVLAVVSQGHLPVLLLLPSVEPAERIAWLERGLDEVLAWPSSAQELCLRLRTLVRRSRRLRELAEGVIRVGGLELRLETRRARLDGRELPLTDYEFRLLSVLARRSGSAVTREQLLELAKGSADESFDRSIDVRVSRLRSKLSDDPRHPRLLKTVRGVGYVLVPRTM